MSDSFTIFIDESGDEGFVFRDPPQKGSSDWFIVSAVITFTSQQSQIIGLADRIRLETGLPPKGLIHFADLSHEKRIRAFHEMQSENLRFASVLIDKRSIKNPEIFTAQRGRLYYYAVRLLLERVSWLCRDTAKKYPPANSKAKVVFEHRKRLKHNDLVGYVDLLKNIGASDGWIATSTEQVKIDWNVLSSDRMETAPKRRYAGLQLADLVASGLFKSLEMSRYGNTEHRFAKMLTGQTYSRSGNFTSYGLKFFPSAPDQNNEYMHWVYKHCMG